MKHKFSRKFERTFNGWRKGILPGLVVIGIVITARLSGIFQLFELMAFDIMLSYRPAESQDERITIIGIDDSDIQSLGTYPVPDGELAALLNKLQSYRPRVIGLNIYRDIPVEPGHAELLKVFKESKNLIGIDQIISVPNVSPPPGLPAEQVGFADIPHDHDGFVRQSMLGEYQIIEESEYRFSLHTRLAEAYLAVEDISLENGFRDPYAMRFGDTEIPRSTSNAGGYIRANVGNNQVLLNFRSGLEPFQIVTLTQVMNDEVESEWLQDRILIIGLMAPGSGGVINSNATKDRLSLMHGVEMQAHATSQIVSAVLDRRPLLKVLPDSIEYLVIFVFGLLGIASGELAKNTIKHLLSVVGISAFITGLSYYLIIVGIWLPLVPALLAFGINSLYLYDRTLRSRIKERQIAVDRIFNLMHSGPLQTLAKILNNTQDLDWSYEHMKPQLKLLDKELRNVYKLVYLETLRSDGSIYLNSDYPLDLKKPLHEILYDVYRETIQQDFPCFSDIKVKVVKFEPMGSENLSFKEKQELCQFLEEALINVGKYGKGATRLQVFCIQEKGHNLIRVVDNGKLLTPMEQSDSFRGLGTKQAEKIAKSLGGKFGRFPASPSGVVCELVWAESKTNSR